MTTPREPRISVKQLHTDPVFPFSPLESYKAGFDLFNGMSLEDVMKNLGLKMHQENGWDQWEWPSHEISGGTLWRIAEPELQELIQ